MSQKPYKALFFDADKTLLDFVAAEKKGLERVFEKNGITLTDEIRSFYLEMNGQLWESYERGEIPRDTVLFTRFGRVFEHFGIDADGVAFEHDYRKELDKGHDLMEGAMELVQTLAPFYELYIVTNGTTETQYKRLGDSGLSPYFKDIFISGEIGSRKPMKAFFDHCFEKAPHLAPKDVLIIGDSLSSDIQGGNNAGIDACWMNAENKINDTNAVPTYEIHKLAELYDILGISKK